MLFHGEFCFVCTRVTVHGVSLALKLREKSLEEACWGLEAYCDRKRSKVISIQSFTLPLTIGWSMSEEKLILTSKVLHQPCYTLKKRHLAEACLCSPDFRADVRRLLLTASMGKEWSLREGSSTHTRKSRSKHCCRPGQNCLSFSTACGLWRKRPSTPSVSFSTAMSSTAISSTHCSCLTHPQ